jgi:hypothetical protein
VRTSQGLVGYLIQPPAKQKAPTVTTHANPSAPTAAGGGGGITQRRTNYDWVLGVLLVLLVVLVGAGLESKPRRGSFGGS